MNICKKAFSCCAAALLLLTSCGQDAPQIDISRHNPEFFRYCFGKDAVCKCVTKEERIPEYPEDTNEYYRITFTDKNGAEYTDTYSFPPYQKSEDKEKITEAEYYDAQIERAVSYTAASYAEDSFVEQVLKKHFDGIETDLGTHIGEEAHFLVNVSCLVSSYGFFAPGPEGADALSKELGAAHISPETGWQLCNADWTTFAGDPQWYWQVSLTVSEDADTEDYLRRFQAAYEEFRACTDQPQSAAFVFATSPPDNGNDQTFIWRGILSFGREIDPKKEKEKDPDFSSLRNSIDQLEAYYRAK